MTGDLELCCKAANDDDISFVGCRPAGLCRANESVWVRGPLTCASGPECAGGHCCALDLEDGEVVVATKPIAIDEPERTPVVEPAPEPASITPVPLDWTPAPTPVMVPKLVCEVGGTVMLDVEVDETGRVTEVEIRERLDPECDALARDALLHAEFEPALTPDGRAVASSLAYAYEFEGP
jgi:TonB family protein